MKLLLFDIDGTILRTDGSGRRSVGHALRTHFGREYPFDAVSYSGKTDPQIFSEVMALGGLSPDESARELDAVIAHYETQMREELRPHNVTLLAGVAALLDRLAADDRVALALLTGNTEAMAYLKLAAVGLDHHFGFGAFGSDSGRRGDLPAIAVERAHGRLGRRFVGKDVLIIGDTEHDVTCGQEIGAYAVAVATGHYTRAMLEPHGPDLLLDSLEDADAFLAALESAGGDGDARATPSQERRAG